MKKLRRKAKKIISLGLALLMVVSTMFVGGIQVKADASQSYEVSYNAETGQVVGLPEIGSVLKATDIIKGAESLDDNTTIVFYAHSLKEEITMNTESDYSMCPISSIDGGEELLVGDLKPVLCSADEGFTLESIYCWKYEYGDKEYTQIEIYLCAIDRPTKLDELTIELDWSKIDAEIGGILSIDTFVEGFIKNEEIDEATVNFFTCIWPENGEPSGSCMIDANTTYSFELVYYLEKGFYFDADSKDDIEINDSLTNNAFHWTYDSSIWDNKVSITFKFTGAELIEKVNEAKNAKNPFNDVNEDAYYFEPVLWAVDNGITAGVSATKFAPDQSCTRAQIVAFLWRAAGCPDVVGVTNPFKDVPVDAYYTEAVLWAVENGITAGVSPTKFGPDEVCTRAQIVTFLWRAFGEQEPTATTNPFKDVPANAYYAKAVLWAVENNITAGLSQTKFGPNSPCTRGQVVSFLYRAYAE